MSKNGLIFKREVGDKVILVTVLDGECVKQLTNEHQHVVTVNNIPELGVTQLNICDDYKMDIKDKVKGLDIDSILCSPLWQN